MAEKFSYSLLMPNRILAEGEAEMVVAPGAEGDFGVLKGHCDLVTKLRAGKVEVHTEGAKAVYIISGGFADVGTEGCTLTIPMGEQQDKLNRAELKQRLAEIGDENPTEKEMLTAMLAVSETSQTS